MRSLLALAALFSVSFAQAAPSHLVVKPGRASVLSKTGAVVGGVAGEELSLLKIETSFGESSNKLVLAYGDRTGRVAKGEPGYFNLTLDRDSRRIVIDLAQVTKTGVDPVELKRRLASSKLITSSEMTMDPLDGTTNLTLTTRQSVEVIVETQSSPQAGVVIEIKPTGASK